MNSPRITSTCLAALGALLMLALPAHAQNADCTKCHAGLVNKKVVHGAMQKGCTSCHSELDAGTKPHTSKGKFPKGLKAEGPALCTNCHDAKHFEGKLVHAPIAAGLCTACHDPHSSNNAGLAPKPPAEQCLDCHGDVKKKPHMIVGFSGGGHPLGDAKKEVADPLRSGKPFYCASCHEPHRSTLPKLMRFEAKGMSACQKCHKM